MKNTEKTTTKIVKLKQVDGLHKRNKHLGRYDFNALIHALPELEKYVIKAPNGGQSINFSDPVAVKLLNKALLNFHYSVTYWDIPQGYLCPPIPGRADYIHRLAEMLERDNSDLQHSLIKVLDIGMGANCIYPIIGSVDYGWKYVASDIDPVSVSCANLIVQNNNVLNGRIQCRLQREHQYTFKNIIQPNEFYDVTMCNPPFHKSLQDAQSGTERKVSNLKKNRSKRNISSFSEQSNLKAALNFGGQKAELWCSGGEAEFINKLASESKQYAQQVLWFSTLISKKDNVRWLQKNLVKLGAEEIQVVAMNQGQKVSRFIAWTFKNEKQRKHWWHTKSRPV
ncbi:23S rRNA (adenine(1618)-N(6))-methyltransferase RlmF [Vibrio sp. TH_r3]|uniref:23S rRNA (adenine(1618)-N(6))-methyltransferase RlmF n=1 Tax=Vibrio sp. TH_r3 TaxID=3082084 RepID=UPI0029541820|nr:23S rRNA (adenine(1618)-N(6))-methyltransferase RlmF [Vibrio sp. TH_r3]MDV7103453.1 23S rRNA (adenine(1618)-N(6))-methyltransferase RlmF [Vibrio sp. TH_r3]